MIGWSDNCRKGRDGMVRGESGWLDLELGQRESLMLLVANAEAAKRELPSSRQPPNDSCASPSASASLAVFVLAGCSCSCAARVAACD
jgi:hypothetical protein